jgi:hypothetical protein
MILVKASEASEAGVLPDERDLARMGRFNQELSDAGVLLAGEGLHPSSRGARVKFAGGRSTMARGPFPRSTDLIAGFWLWQVGSMAEAIQWVQRAPFEDGAEIEIRPVLEADDFGEAYTPELREQEERLRVQAALPK